MPLRTGSLRSFSGIAPALRGGAISFSANAMLWLSLVACVAAQGMAASAVTAQSSLTDPPALAHYLLTASAGLPLRLAKQDKYDQGTLAPAFTDVLAGYMFPGSRSLRHGAGLGFSLNLSDDGGFTEPVLRYDQFVITPSYLLSLHVDPAWFALAHAGLPIVATGGATVGAELAFAFGYRLLAGFGAFAEGSVDLFIGTESSLNPTVSLEAGFFLDYEVLP